jgi:hypothetical protein
MGGHLISVRVHVFGGLILIAAMVSSVLFEPTCMASGPVVVARTEWISERFGNSIFPDFIDLDGDGSNEMIISAEDEDSDNHRWGKFRIYDLPGYHLKFSVDIPGFVNAEYIDLQGDGIRELIIRSIGMGNSNITIISGKTFDTLWKSPEYYNSNSEYFISDVDADGEREMVWTGDNTPGGGESAHLGLAIHVFGTLTFKEKRNFIINCTRPYEFELKNIDSDPEQELIFRTHEMRINVDADTRIWVVDLSNQCVQWVTPNDPHVDRISELQYSDFDNDSQKEVLASFRQTDPVNGTVASLRLFSGDNGSLDWIENVSGSIQSFDQADVNGDGINELLVAADISEDYWSSEGRTTLKIIDPVGRRELWSIGPFQRNGLSGTYFYARDTNGDHIAEPIITNYTFGKNWTISKATDTILNGTDFSVMWKSPVHGGKTDPIDIADYDMDGIPEILLSDTFSDTDGKVKWRLLFCSTHDASEDWTSGIYDGAAAEIDWNSALQNSSAALFLRVIDDTDRFSQKIQFDMISRRPIWTSPSYNSAMVVTSNLIDGPDQELIFNGINWNDKGASSVLSIYDYKNHYMLWTSGVNDGSHGFLKTGDLDNDHLGEILTIEERDKGDTIDFFQLKILEFTPSLDSGQPPSKIDPSSPNQQNNGQTGGASASLVLTAAAVTSVSGSTGIAAFIILYRRRNRQVNDTEKKEVKPPPHELRPASELQFRQ